MTPSNMMYLSDKKVMLFALGRWINEIRTYNPTLSLSEARAQQKPVREQSALSREESALCGRLEEMRKELVR